MFTDRVAEGQNTCGILHYKQVADGAVNNFSGNITEIMLAYTWSSALPSGTKIVIQGVDA